MSVLILSTCFAELVGRRNENRPRYDEGTPMFRLEESPFFRNENVLSAKLTEIYYNLFPKKKRFCPPRRSKTFFDYCGANVGFFRAPRVYYRSPKCPPTTLGRKSLWPLYRHRSREDPSALSSSHATCEDFDPDVLGCQEPEAPTWNDPPPDRPDVPKEPSPSSRRPFLF